jgi:hypothetical protein
MMALGPQWGGPCSREDLAILLENEAYITAADRRSADGEDPRRVLGELRPFTPRYDDSISRGAVQLFQRICRGELEVT